MTGAHDGAARGGSIGGGSAGDGDANRAGGAPAARAVSADPLARWVFAALVLACLAAFVITQRLKHTPTAVQSFKSTPIFSPTPTNSFLFAATNARW